MKKADILLIGGDTRQYYLNKMLKSGGHRVLSFLVPGTSSTEASIETLKKYISASRYVIGPIPFSRDSSTVTTVAEYSDYRLSADLLISLLTPEHTFIAGSINKHFCEKLTKRDIPFFDINTFESVKYGGSCLTAEGLLKYIIETVPFSISGSNILVLGFGKCGCAISRTLHALGAKICVYNRSKYPILKAKSLGFNTIDNLSPIAFATHYDIIINTIPHIIMTEELLSCLTDKTFLFDVASAPGGFAMDSVKKLGLHYKNCPGIPGNTSPQSAAAVIYNALCDEI